MEFARKGAGWCNQRRSKTAMPPCEGQTTRGSHQAHSEGAGSPSRCAGGASWRRPCLGVGRGELRSRTGVGSARRSARRPVMGQRRPRRTRRLYPPVQVHQLINFRLALRNAGPGGYVPPGETSVSRVSPAKKKDLRRRSAAPREGRGGVKKSTPRSNKHAPSPAERLARCVHVVECPGACSQPRRAFSA